MNSDKTLSYEEASGPLVDSVLTSSNGDCTCSGFIRELSFQVYLVAIPEKAGSTVGGYEIDKIVADFVIQEQPLTQKGCGSDAAVQIE